jgi:Protein of unknown function (DUF402)
VQSGDPVLLRSIYRGRVRWTFPHRYVGEHDGRLGLYCQPGNRGMLMKRALGATSGYLEPWVRGDPPHAWAWRDTHVLRFMRRGDAHTIEVHWDEAWSHLGWYVNLQAPLEVDGTRFDTTDWALDIVIDRGGTWRWKDEDDFVQAIDLGVFDAESARAVRAEGERVIAERPWPTGWEDWRPPAEWTPLTLPEDWDVV